MNRLKWLVLKDTIVRHCTLVGFNVQIIIYLLFILNIHFNSARKILNI